MKISMVSLFRQLRLHLIAVTLLSIVILLLNTSQLQSSSLIKSLYKHQQLITTLTTLEQNDFGLTLIKLEELRNRLEFNIDDLKNTRSYDYLSNLFQDTQHHQQRLEQLHKHTMRYHTIIQTNTTTKAAKSTYRDSLLAERSAIEQILTTLIQTNIMTLFQKEAINSYLIYFTVFYIVLIALIYFHKINTSIRDFDALMLKKPDYDYQVKELDYLSKMLYKSDEERRQENYLDPLSKLNSLRGIIHKYAKKKIAYNYTIYVYVFSIDNYKEIRSKISEELSQSVLKKISFILSLYEKANDHVARIGYDEFALVLTSDNQESAFNACEQLRKTIEETRFKLDAAGVKHLSISGVFIVKPKEKTVESAIEYGRNFLRTSEKRETNKNSIVLNF